MSADIGQWLDSVAYHEAGHTTAAVLQDMPLQERGIFTDLEGSGVSYYCHREPGDLASSARDQFERHQTIIALYAGIVSQRRFSPDYPDDQAWTKDRATIRQLLEELHPNDPAIRSTAQIELCNRAEEFVSHNWSIIEGLASSLLAKPEAPLPPIEIGAGWSLGRKGIGKWMRGSEVVEFFKKLQIPARVREDCRQDASVK